jgi:hypothetical protein
MLFKIAFGLLIAWLLGVLGAYPGGDLVHVLLLVGLMLLYASSSTSKTGSERSLLRPTSCWFQFRRSLMKWSGNDPGNAPTTRSPVRYGRGM